MNKSCSQCLEEKEANCFYKAKKASSGLSSQCKSCLKKQEDLRLTNVNYRYVTEKACTKCKLVKSATEFHKRKASSDNLNLHCKACVREHQIGVRILKPKRIVMSKEEKMATRREWAAKNADQIRARKRKYILEKEASCPEYKLARRLRNRLYKFAKGLIKSSSAVRDLGCSIEELRQHLEKQFKPGMSWDNYGEWHIDHIAPLAIAKVRNDITLIDLCHYTNLQPLWASENLKKSSKVG